MSNSTYITPDDLMTIDEVVSKWPKYFTANELKKAMRCKRISYVSKSRARLLTRAAINEYLSNQTVRSRSMKVRPGESNSWAAPLEVEEHFMSGRPWDNLVAADALISSILQHYWKPIQTPPPALSKHAAPVACLWNG